MSNVTCLAVSITIRWEFHPQQWGEEVLIKTRVMWGDQGHAYGVGPKVVVAVGMWNLGMCILKSGVSLGSIPEGSSIWY